MFVILLTVLFVLNWCVYYTYKKYEQYLFFEDQKANKKRFVSKKYLLTQKHRNKFVLAKRLSQLSTLNNKLSASCVLGLDMALLTEQNS